MAGKVRLVPCLTSHFLADRLNARLGWEVLVQSPLSSHCRFPQDLSETRELLEEVLEGKQRLEEQLRLRERELTALKGALKEEVASRDQEVEQVRQQYQRDAEQLRRSMQDATQARDRSRGWEQRTLPGRGPPRGLGVLGLVVVVTGTPPKRHKGDVMKTLVRKPAGQGTTRVRGQSPMGK